MTSQTGGTLGIFLLDKDFRLMPVLRTKACKTTDLHA